MYSGKTLCRALVVPAEGWAPPEVPQNVSTIVLEGVPLGDLQLDAEAEAAIVAFLATLSDGHQPAPGGCAD